MAGEQGREVFAIPGHPLDPRAEGTNGLQKSGATLVTEPDDVLQALSPLLREPLRGQAGRAASSGGSATPRDTLPLDETGSPASLLEPDRNRLLEALGPAPTDVDELARATGLSPRVVQIGLLELALAGRLERHGHHLVSLKA